MKGLVFIIRLRVDKTGTGRGASVQDVNEAKEHGVILLVEDHDLVRASTTRMLKSLGYEVTTATNGREALKRLEEGTPFDLLISDITMPDKGGTRLAEELSARSIALPIIFISGYTDEAPAIAAKLSQHVQFLPKPLTP